MTAKGVLLDARWGGLHTSLRLFVCPCRHSESIALRRPCRMRRQRERLSFRGRRRRYFPRAESMAPTEESTRRGQVTRPLTGIMPLDVFDSGRRRLHPSRDGKAPAEEPGHRSARAHPRTVLRHTAGSCQVATRFFGRAQRLVPVQVTGGRSLNGNTFGGQDSGWGAGHLPPSRRFLGRWMVPRQGWCRTRSLGMTSRGG